MHAAATAHVVNDIRFAVLAFDTGILIATLNVLPCLLCYVLCKLMTQLCSIDDGIILAL